MTYLSHGFIAEIVMNGLSIGLLYFICRGLNVLKPINKGTKTQIFKRKCYAV